MRTASVTVNPGTCYRDCIGSPIILRVWGKGSLYIYDVENLFEYEKQDVPKTKAEIKREAAEAEKAKAASENAFLTDADASGDESVSEIGEDSGLENETLRLVDVTELDLSKSIKTKPYRSRSAAYEAYKKKRSELEQFRADFPTQVYRNAMSKLNKAYGYAPVNSRFWMKEMKGDKHPDTKMWNDACVATKTLFGQFRFNQDISGKQAKFDPTVDYFQEKLDGIDDKDRKQKKMKKAAFRNLESLLYYLDRYDDLVTLAQANMDSKVVDKLSKNALKRADRQRALLAFHGLNSCHIVSTEEIAADEIETEEELAGDDDAEADGAK